jgi:uncharacterized phage-associated protein
MAIIGNHKAKSCALVSDYFIALSNETGNLISNLKLQKLVYYAQAWHLANFKKDLFVEDFQAWVHGPVMPALYGEYKMFGWKPIIREDLTSVKLLEIKQLLSNEVLSLLDLITDEYFGMSAFELEQLTHNEEPWVNSRIGLQMDEPSDRIITKESIMKYYSRYIDEEVKSK